ncbi:MAG TPA: hypothetical protein VFL81_02690 [Candidatus Saccharimonadales bacterium]|nr:hypothetical protein [Candidatus Saccharimonadales bacterium]
MTSVLSAVSMEDGRILIDFRSQTAKDVVSTAYREQAENGETARARVLETILDSGQLYLDGRLERRLSEEGFGTRRAQQAVDWTKRFLLGSI